MLNKPIKMKEQDFTETNRLVAENEFDAKWKQDMSNFYALERIRLKYEQKHNERILKAIHSLKGDLFVENLKFALTDGCAIWGKWQIVAKPIGEPNSDYDIPTWIDQYGPGMAGDDYNGFIYVELKPDKFLKVEYSC